MNVTRVYTGTGSHIEPPLEDHWSNRQKLEWHAAVAEHDTGLRVLVHPMPRRFGLGEDYSIQVGRRSTSAMPYDRAWTYINGISVGGQQVRGLFESSP